MKSQKGGLSVEMYKRGRAQTQREKQQQRQRQRLQGIPHFIYTPVLLFHFEISGLRGGGESVPDASENKIVYTNVYRKLRILPNGLLLLL